MIKNMMNMRAVKTRNSLGLHLDIETRILPTK